MITMMIVLHDDAAADAEGPLLDQGAVAVLLQTVIHCHVVITIIIIIIITIMIICISRQ